MRKRHTLKYVEQFFENHGCELLEEKYINNHTSMRYRCNCGGINQIRFDKFNIGQRCSKCAIKKTTNITRHPFNYIYNYFKEQNCKLLEKTYQNLF